MLIIKVMKMCLTTMLIIASITINAQPNYYSGSQVTASDGTVYKIKHIANGVRVYNASNNLESITNTLPNKETPSARISGNLEGVSTDLNKNFSKDRLLEFSKTRVRVFRIADRTRKIREVYFYLRANTPITVNELRKLEKIALSYSMIITKYELKPSRGTTSPLYWTPVDGSVDEIPEFNEIPYFTTIEAFDFNYAYKAQMVIRRGDTSWLVPVTRP